MIKMVISRCEEKKELHPSPLKNISIFEIVQTNFPLIFLECMYAKYKLYIGNPNLLYFLPFIQFRHYNNSSN